MTYRRHLGLIALATTAPLCLAAEPTKEGLAFFEEKIRPILADNCYQCHSVAEGKAKGSLTLDTMDGWKKGGDGGQAIIPGDAEKSLLYTAISYKDEDMQMPPTSKGGKLSDQQIADVAAWIKMGAPDPRKEAAKSSKLSGLNDKARAHWAFQPVKKPAVPATKNSSWCRTPIDAFILQKLEANKMLPSPDADREALLRRVTYDLTGLPPTFREVEAFLADESPKAFENVVDRLLASPAYGERWARHWLDTARYSDTIGGDRNAARTTEYRYPDAWTYRDYVTQSMNADKPYTDFIIEQLAADKLPNIKPNDPRLAALGFLTVGERFRNVNDIINDRIDTVSKGFLGLTVACARCHDHMFDPVPTSDYYALHGVFANTTEPEQGPSLNAKATEADRKDFQVKYDAMMKEMRSRYFKAVDYYLAEIRRAPEAYIRSSFLGANRRDEKDLTARNELIKKHKLDEQFVQYLQRGIQRNPSVWGPLMSYRRGNQFVPRPMTEMGAGMMADRMESMMEKQMGGSAAKLAKDLRDRLQQPTNAYVNAALAAKKPQNFDEAVKVYSELITEHADKGKALIPAFSSAKSQTIPGYEDKALLDLLRGPFEIEPAAVISKDWCESAIAGWPNQMLGRARLNFGDINLLETSHPGAPARAMVVEDKANPKDSNVFIRGQQEVKGPLVPRGFLSILSPGHKPVTFKEGSGRLELAKLIASKENPLTARVLVNRVWMHHFGEGLVSTPDDLGVMSEKPSHPELLDYLATWFMENGWSLKKLHKFIVMSRVFQESTHTRPEYEDLDPDNRMLWRANVRRLDFEAMRDSLLVYSGQLDRTVGGKPINLTDEPYSYRRSVYGYVDRGNLPELMAHFDFSDPDMPNSKRTSTVVPQQALFLMNSPMAVDVSRKILARPEVEKQPNDVSRINVLYKVLFQRRPNKAELQLGLAFVQSEEKATDGELSTNGAKKNTASNTRRNDSRFSAITNDGKKVERKPLTAWETYVQALLFSNEAAYVN